MAYRSDYFDKARVATPKQLAQMEAGRQRLADHRQVKLLADGRKALSMRKRGATPTEMLAAIGGSRPRMYKAIHKALDTDGWEHQPLDPLLS